jgi:hypothetical protein
MFLKIRCAKVVNNLFIQSIYSLFFATQQFNNCQLTPTIINIDGNEQFNLTIYPAKITIENHIIL